MIDCYVEAEGCMLFYPHYWSFNIFSFCFNSSFLVDLFPLLFFLSQNPSFLFLFVGVVWDGNLLGSNPKSGHLQKTCLRLKILSSRQLSHWMIQCMKIIQSKLVHPLQMKNLVAQEMKHGYPIDPQWEDHHAKQLRRYSPTKNYHLRLKCEKLPPKAKMRRKEL